jgi:flagellar L-ring protein precursor FlgH
MEDFSLIYTPADEPRVIKVHDILTIIVDEKAEVTSNSRFNRNRSASLKAELKEFIRIADSGNLATAAPNQPTIDANLQGRLNSTGQMTDQEGIRYRIAATVVDVMPNGNLVLEARKTIRTNRDVWEYSLTGILRSEDISRDNTALSENVANLRIDKKTAGKVSDSTQRPWGVWLYDRLSPF